MHQITVCVTGASGSIYFVRLVKFLLEQKNFLVHLIFSETALKVLKLETEINLSIDSLTKNKQILLDYFREVTQTDFSSEKINLLDNANLAACVASGSHRNYENKGLVIVPCSVGTLGRIANGTSDDLISRAADVSFKERKKTLFVLRETPLNQIHLQNLLKISQAGGAIIPAMPAFYHQPKNIDQLVDFMVGKILDLLEIENTLFKRWQS